MTLEGFGKHVCENDMNEAYKSTDMVSSELYHAPKTSHLPRSLNLSELEMHKRWAMANS